MMLLQPKLEDGWLIFILGFKQIAGNRERRNPLANLVSESPISSSFTNYDRKRGNPAVSRSSKNTPVTPALKLLGFLLIFLY